MKTDEEVEYLLRATFDDRVATVTAAPRWDPPAGPAPDRPEPLDMTAFPGHSSARRWRVPAIAAAAVVAVAVAASLIVAGAANPARRTQIAGQPSADAAAAVPVAATVDADGIITVSRSTPAVVLDIYQDALCPICSDFEAQNGADLSAAVQQGRLAVRYRMVDFLNDASASGTYSTRAYAALLAVAIRDGQDATVFQRFYTALFAPSNQPKEMAPSDLSNDELAALAASVGASRAAQEDIVDGAWADDAATDARRNLESLTTVAAAAGRSPGTPTVAQGGTAVAINSPDWLATVLRPTG